MPTVQTERDWIRTDPNHLPPRGAKVDWLEPSGAVVTGGTYEGVWILPGPGAMYVYYTPPYWRLAQ